MQVRTLSDYARLPFATLPDADLPLPRPGELDEDETANEPPDVKPDHRHWPQPDDGQKRPERNVPDPAGDPERRPEQRQAM